ncbi:hypothetical protein EON65_43610 [archaeon]|nr:MAG: hypothetical protein EON65_43610 [archaeon]
MDLDFWDFQGTPEIYDDDLLFLFIHMCAPIILSGRPQFNIEHAHVPSWSGLWSGCSVVHTALASLECINSLPLHYALTPGYIATDFSNMSYYATALSATHKCLYYCHEILPHTLDVHFTSNHRHVDQSFYGRRFLYENSHRRIAIVGDSLSKQLYMSIASALSSYKHTYMSEDILSNDTFTTCRSRLQMARYEEYNVSLVSSMDPFLTKLHDLQTFLQHHNTSHLDAIVFGAGIWFKPLEKIHPANASVTYFEHMDMVVKSDLRDALERARSHIKTLYPQVTIMWKLIAHSGLSDKELVHYPQFFTPQWNASYHWNVTTPYRDGWLWTNLTLEAPWVAKYNTVVRAIAEKNCDILMDAYDMSHKYMDYFSGSGLRLHADSLHYCPGTVHQGEMWLVQELLRRHYRHP